MARIAIAPKGYEKLIELALPYTDDRIIGKPFSYNFQGKLPPLRFNEDGIQIKAFKMLPVDGFMTNIITKNKFRTHSVKCQAGTNICDVELDILELSTNTSLDIVYANKEVISQNGEKLMIADGKSSDEFFFSGEGIKFDLKGVENNGKMEYPKIKIKVKINDSGTLQDGLFEVVPPKLKKLPAPPQEPKNDASQKVRDAYWDAHEKWLINYTEVLLTQETYLTIPQNSASISLDITAEEIKAGEEKYFQKYVNLIKQDPENAYKYQVEYATEVIKHKFIDKDSARKFLAGAILSNAIAESTIAQALSERLTPYMGEVLTKSINNSIKNEFSAIEELSIAPPQRVQDFVDLGKLNGYLSQYNNTQKEYLNLIESGDHEGAKEILENLAYDYDENKCSFKYSSDNFITQKMDGTAITWDGISKIVDNKRGSIDGAYSHLQLIQKLKQGLENESERVKSNSTKVNQALNLNFTMSAIEKSQDIVSNINLYSTQYCPQKLEDTFYQKALKSGKCDVVKQINLDAVNSYFEKLNTGGFFNPCYVPDTNKTCGCFSNGNTAFGLMWANLIKNGGPSIKWDPEKVDPNTGKKGMRYLHIPPVTHNVPLICERGADIYFSVNTTEKGGLTIDQGGMRKFSGECSQIFNKALGGILGATEAAGFSPLDTLVNIILSPLRALALPFEGPVADDIVASLMEKIPEDGVFIRPNIEVKEIYNDENSIVVCATLN